jgi:hypothetical protein
MLNFNMLTAIGERNIDVRSADIWSSLNAALPCFMNYEF